jgi:hypothetical protein
LAKRKTHYVNNKDLFNAMIVFKENKRNSIVNKEVDRINNYIGECLILIANRLSNRPNFMNYSYKDEMIADGIENCLMYINNFDPNKSNNPFAYFTQIIKFSFIRRIQKEKKQQYVKLKNIENHFTLHELLHESNDMMDRELYENNQQYIKDYEISLTEKKKKIKVSGVEKFL